MQGKANKSHRKQDLQVMLVFLYLDDESICNRNEIHYAGCLFSKFVWTALGLTLSGSGTTVRLYCCNELVQSFPNG